MQKLARGLKEATAGSGQGLQEAQDRGRPKEKRRHTAQTYEWSHWKPYWTAAT